MAAFRIHTSMFMNPTAVQLGNAAMGAWARIGSWAAQQDSAEHIPRQIVEIIGKPSEVALLVSAGMIIPDGDNYRLAKNGSWSIQYYRETLPAKLRAMVVQRDGMTCKLCGKAIASRKELHIDHIIPVSRGGKNTLNNLQPSHAVCNMQKRNKV